MNALHVAVVAVLLAACGASRQPGACPEPREGDAQAADAGVSEAAVPLAERGTQACEEARARSAGSTAQGAGDFPSLVRDARKLLSDLRDTSWPERRQDAAEVLEALARAIAAAPTFDAEVEEAVCQLSGQAAQLALEDADPFRATARIKGALAAALPALDLQATRGADDAALKPWLESARAAVESLERNTTLAFQGAAIQDAFRTVSDALLILAQRTPTRSPAPDGGAP